MKPDRDRDLEAVRQLWAGRFQGVLSTQSLAEPGYPFGSVVPCCLDRAGLPLFLLSHLAQHSKNLEADPRCAFTVAEPTAGDVQESQRLTCVGNCTASPPEDGDARKRFFRYFPWCLTYYTQLNFKLYRLVPNRFHYNGGFATARWLSTDRVVRPSTLSEAAEATLIERVEQAHPLLLRRRAAEEPDEDPPRVAGIDPYGLDLAIGVRLERFPFPRRLDNSEDLDDYLQEFR